MPARTRSYADEPGRFERAGLSCFRLRHAVALCPAILLVAAVAYAAPEIGPHDVATLFYVAKSDDRNRVD